MKCFYCSKEASAKIGQASGSMFTALLPLFIKNWLNMTTWTKREVYCCNKHYLENVFEGKRILWKTFKNQKERLKNEHKH